MKRNFLQSVGEILPFSSERTRRQNRRTGAAVLATLAIITGASLKDPVADAAFKTKEVCVTTSGSNTVWGNAEEAKHMLQDAGVPVQDTGEITHELETEQATTVCGKMRTGFLSNVVGIVADPDIEVRPNGARDDTVLVAQESN